MQTHTPPLGGLTTTDTVTRVVKVHCLSPGCAYCAVAWREGQALKSLAAHLVAVHMRPLQDAA
jgi:hypothetical protein